jgi:DNA-binding sugar fermentation-stimulating protein
VSSAERLLYEQFAQQLPESFIVMHSVKWLMRDRKRYDRSGEIDFLIVNRELGLLVLEVKGAHTGRRDN